MVHWIWIVVVFVFGYALGKYREANRWESAAYSEDPIYRGIEPFWVEKLD